MAKNVAEVFVETLIAAGVKRVYGVVGDSLNGLTEAIRQHDAIEWIGQCPSQQTRILVVIEAGCKVGRVLPVGLAFLQPQSGAGDAVHQDLHGVRTVVDHVLPHHQHAGHVVGPKLTCVKQNLAKAKDFSL